MVIHLVILMENHSLIQMENHMMDAMASLLVLQVEHQLVICSIFHLVVQAH